MGDEMQAGSGSEARTEAREILETYFSESGFYTATMTPRGRLVAEVFDCRGEEFVSDYLEASGHPDPGVAVRLHDTCGALYGGQLSVEDAYGAWDEWESVLRGLAEGYGLGSLCTLMALADPLTPEERISDKGLAPLDREALSQAMDWLKAYIVSYSGEDLEGFCDETIALAELCVDTERGTGAPEMLRSEEELRQDEELDMVGVPARGI